MAQSAAEGGRARVAVFLDRDGVINRRAAPGEYIRNWSEFQFTAGAIAALAELRRAGAELFVATNQRGVARGLVAPDDLVAIHDGMTAELLSQGVTLAGIYTCPHETDTCDCRKPDVGLFMQAQVAHPWIDFGRSHMVGDSMNDLEAGHRLGMRLWAIDEDGQFVGAAREQGYTLAGSAATLAELVAMGALTTAVEQQA